MRVAGSTQGLEELASGRAVLAGCHLMDPESGTWNLPAVRAHLPGGAHVVIHWARRVQGLITAPDNPLAITGIADAAKRGLRFAIRSEGAGSQRLLDLLLTRDGLSESDLNIADRPVETHADLGRPHRHGARPIAGSDSRPLPDNSDSSPSSRTRASILVMARRDYFEPPVQALLAFRPQRRVDAPRRVSRRLRSLGPWQSAVERLKGRVADGARPEAGSGRHAVTGDHDAWTVQT